MSRLMPLSQLNSKLDSVIDNESLRQRVLQPPSNEGTISEWLSWCRNNCKVKVIDSAVPSGILPQGIKGILHDVKVESRGPDDKVYHAEPDIRDKVARGNTVLTLQNAATNEQTVDLVVFALRKFTGGMGDEDENQPEDNNVWRRYFLKPMEDVDRIVVMHKENGEAAHFSARFIDGDFYLIGGSKNVHMIFRNEEDIEKYNESRFLVAKTVCKSILKLVTSLEEEKRSLLFSFLSVSKLSVVMEILQPSYQHVVDLSHLVEPCLKFLCFTAQYQQNEDSSSLTAIPPHLALEIGSFLGLLSTQYEIIPSDAFNQKELEIRNGKGYEGAVLYFLDKEDNVVGLLKKKTCWYILLRAIREKVSYAMSEYNKNPGGFKSNSVKSHVVKLQKRLDEIQRWLSLTDQETAFWKSIGSSFLTWMVEQVIITKDPDLTNRGRFPQNWSRFIRETGTVEDFNSHSDTTSTKSFREREETEPIQLLEPDPLSPVIMLDAAILNQNQTAGGGGDEGAGAVINDNEGQSVVACIIRELDLVGKNFAKMKSFIAKIHLKTCKEKTLGFISTHDLKKIQTMLKVTVEPLENISMMDENGDNISGADLLAQALAGEGKLLRAHLLSKQSFQTLATDQDKVLSVAPLVGGCCSTRVTEETTDILVTIHSNTLNQGLSILASLLKQCYHAKIGNGLGVDKTLVVEKVRLTDTDGSTTAAYPLALDL